MSFLSTVAAAAIVPPDEMIARRVSMQTVLDDTTDETERKRVRRVSDFFLEPLSTLDGGGDLLGWFDDQFPEVKALGARPLPGADRQFWSSKSAYAKWREVVRRRIRTTNGDLAAREELRARDDGWTPLLRHLKSMTKDDGPVHHGQYGAIVTFADLARQNELEPSELTPSNIAALLDVLPAHLREKATQTIFSLNRLKVHPSVAAFLPATFDVSSLRVTAQTHVPDTIRNMIDAMLDKAQLEADSYDDVTQTWKIRFNETSRSNYSAALIALARGAADAMQTNLASLNSLQSLFACETRRAVIAHWTEMAGKSTGFQARTAAGYVRVIIQIGEANGIDVSEWRKSRKNNAFLLEGKDSAEKMAKKNMVFCQNLMASRQSIKIFLRQHVLYQQKAKRILSKGTPLTKSDLEKIRRLGTCAAFSALCLRGAALRKGTALSIKSHGPEQNLHRIKDGDKRHFLLRISKKNMKGEYVELPPIPIHDNQYAGYEVIDWFLREIRPLFDHANPEWCENNKVAQTPFLFPSEKSAKALNGALLHKWISKSSYSIGIPMRPHNFRHGLATLLLAKSWGNRNRAADYLGCSVGVIDTYYGWIDKRQKIEGTQVILAEYLFS
ncbi:hypothetical protein PVW53_20015 [Seohaeicola sp. SP36]|uniref:hypothetical protein n=1 Tax=unclassified Seohaeicola TaxID=2641111 RepID=UPI00237B0834|nr:MULTISPECIES: hypothetical protein [unclassified Seohaeicola]MDD9709552.1 hypothetical protein [Seohaeicola sp. 4SK31]MDD9737796.1 hypothetical protein [Seohaeicola sp. SP36]